MSGNIRVIEQIITSNSQNIPNGDYLQLMDELKICFDEFKKYEYVQPESNFYIKILCKSFYDAIKSSISIVILILSMVSMIKLNTYVEATIESILVLLAALILLTFVFSVNKYYIIQFQRLQHDFIGLDFNF